MNVSLIARAQLLFFCSLVVSPTFGQAVLVASGTQVWKIDPPGTFDRLDYDFGGPGLQVSIQGTTGPVVSPDQKGIAFTRGNDLWVLDLDSLSSTQATKVGRPGTNQFASVFVLITSWSADSREILYYVEKGETEDPDSEGPERKIRTAPYGNHIYDLQTRSSKPAFLPGEFLAWLPDGDFLVKVCELTSAQLMRVHPGDKNGQLVGAEPGDYGQVKVKPGGKQIIATRGSEIVLVDLVGGKTSSLVKGTWAEFQWPDFSPSGNQFSYLRQYPLSTPGWYGGELLVDGSSVYRVDKGFLSYWIKDDTIALLVYQRDPQMKPTWVLVNSKTGKEVSRPAH